MITTPPPSAPSPDNQPPHAFAPSNQPPPAGSFGDHWPRATSLGKQSPLEHLGRRLALIEQRVRTLTELRRQDDPAPDDRFRGLYLTHSAMDSVLSRHPPAVPDLTERLAEIEGETDLAELAGTSSPLRHLARSFGLSELDTDILLTALAPDLDARFEQLYGYLNDDVSQRRATARLILDLLGIPATDARARSRFDPTAPLITGGLVEIENPGRPFLTRTLRVPDQVTAFLVGGDPIDPLLLDLAQAAPMIVRGDLVAHIVRGLQADRPVFLREGQASAARGLAAAAFAELGLGVLALDLTRIPAEVTAAEFARAAARQARLRSAGLLAGPVEALTGRIEVLRALNAVPVPLVLTGRSTWDPAWSRVVPAVLTAPALSPTQATALWRAALPGVPAGLDPAAETSAFRLGVDQIAATAEAARTAAVVDGTPLTGEVLRAGARSRNGAGLERLARRIQPAVCWNDLVLPGEQLDRLRELAIRARYREQVIRGWNMRPGGGRGAGVSALFTGESGTGKTLSAEVIAAELGVDLYVVDLATVVDKYIGETEKNLERIFTEATGVNGVLLFDEADAIFGKRSEVSDARDRYANVEVAYLLQRMESFDGLAILTTNLRANLDDAFSRRLDLIVHFPQPGEPERELLWDRCLGRTVPRASDLDLTELARFELSGGDIRSAAVTAAYYAAANSRPVGRDDLLTAVEHEFTKLGRLSPGIR